MSSGSMLLRFHDGEERCDLLAAGKDGAVIAARDVRLQEAAAKLRGRHVVVLLPASDVLLTRCSVPTSNRRQVLAAMPFALEDKLSGDVSELGVQAGTRHDDGSHAAAVVARARLRATCERLKSAGVSARAMVSEVLAVPWQVGTYSVLVRESMAVVRRGPDNGFGCDLANLEDLLRLAIKQAGGSRPATIHFYCGRSGEVRLAGQCAHRLGVPGVEHASATGDVLAWMRGPDLGVGGMNLLPLVTSEEAGALWSWRPIRLTVALVMIWLGLLVGESWLERNTLADERQRLSAEIESAYRTTFPDARNVVNPRAQMQAQLERLRSAADSHGDFIGLLDKIAPALTARGGTVVEALDFNDSVMELAVTTADMHSLESLSADIALGGRMRVDIQSASVNGEQVRGRLRVARTP